MCTAFLRCNKYSIDEVVHLRSIAAFDIVIVRLEGLHFFL
jgi:hypothetical protein